MLAIFERWSALADSRIEGIEPIAIQFRTLVTQIKKKPYDVLNTRKTEFDSDFDQFMDDVDELRHRLQDFLDKVIDLCLCKKENWRGKSALPFVFLRTCRL
jgi:dynein heavy chain